MIDSIFRKKSVDRISSPEQLNDYIKVANPGVWMLLGGIVLILAAMCVWAIFGRMDTVVHGVAVSEKGSVVCYVSEERVEKLEKGMTFTIGSAEYSVSEIAELPEFAESVLSDYAMHIGGFQPQDWVYSVKAAGKGVENGVYEVEIVVDSVSPKTFVVN